RTIITHAKDECAREAAMFAEMAHDLGWPGLGECDAAAKVAGAARVLLTEPTLPENVDDALDLQTIMPSLYAFKPYESEPWRTTDRIDVRDARWISDLRATVTPARTAAVVWDGNGGPDQAAERALHALKHAADAAKAEAEKARIDVEETVV